MILKSWVRLIVVRITNRLQCTIPTFVHYIWNYTVGFPRFDQPGLTTLKMAIAAIIKVPSKPITYFCVVIKYPLKPWFSSIV
jgi:hypothetical protein